VRLSFTEELGQLDAAIQEEGDLVLRALRSALNALARGDDELADEVIRFDDEIDKRYIGIEEGVHAGAGIELAGAAKKCRPAHCAVTRAGCWLCR